MAKWRQVQASAFCTRQHTQAPALIRGLTTGRHPNKESSYAFGGRRVANYLICDHSWGRGMPASWRLQRQAAPQGEHLPPVSATVQTVPTGEVPGPACALILNLDAMEVPGSLLTLQAEWRWKSGKSVCGLFLQPTWHEVAKQRPPPLSLDAMEVLGSYPTLQADRSM